MTDDIFSAHRFITSLGLGRRNPAEPPSNGGRNLQQQRLLPERMTGDFTNLKIPNGEVATTCIVWAEVAEEARPQNPWYTFDDWFTASISKLRLTPAFTGKGDDVIKNKCRSSWYKLVDYYGVAERRVNKMRSVG